MELAECCRPTERLATASVNCDGMKTETVCVNKELAGSDAARKILISGRKMLTFSGCSVPQESKRLCYLCLRLNVIRVLC